ncbi:MAG: hypothetical protein ABIQ18_41200 [Umezawaea sp.]
MERKHEGRHRGRLALFCALAVLVPLTVERADGKLPCGVDTASMGVALLLATVPWTALRLARLVIAGQEIGLVEPAPQRREDEPCPAENP